MNRRGPHPTDLPHELRSGPFTHRTGIASGLSKRRLRALDLDHSYWGIRAARSPVGLIEKCSMLQLRMPDDAFFTHSTAALLAGIPVPWHLETDARLHVSVPSPARAPHATGIRGHRSSASDHERVETQGVRHTVPARTWCDLADIVPLLELVAAGDFVIHRRSPLATISDLAVAIDSRKSKRNVRKLREALSLLNDGAESPPESMLRVILVQAGFATPRVNHVVVDRSGEFVARTDLYLVEHNLVLEYQGDYHRSNQGQWRADMTRRSRLEAAGPRVMELNADDLKDPIELVARIRRRIAVR